MNATAAALKAAADRTALVLLDDFQLRNKLTSVLEEQGLAISEGPMVAPDVERLLSLEPAVDVVFLHANVEPKRFDNVMRLLKDDPRTKAAPIYVFADASAPHAALEGYEAIAEVFSPDDARAEKMAPVAADVLAESRSAFTDAEAAVVLKAARALAGVEPANTAYPLAVAEPALVKALTGYGDEVSAGAIAALARFGAGGSVQGLAAVVAGDASVELKVAAARALAAVLGRTDGAASAETIAVLQGALNAEDQTLREAGAEALSAAAVPAGALVGMVCTDVLGGE